MSQTEIKNQVEELSVESFETFCEDIAGMFGIDMTCRASQSGLETAASLSKKYKKLAALFTVKASGALDGNFHIVLDKEGLFTLAGTIVMLPEKRIQEVCKKGRQEDADELSDAVGETGNLLVGSWDRIFREGWSEHRHFLQTGTFIGAPWNNCQEKMGIAEDEPLTYLPIEMTVGGFPPFQCGVIFPESIFNAPAAEMQETAAPEVPAEAIETAEQASQTPPPQETPDQAETVYEEAAAEATVEPVEEASVPETSQKASEPKGVVTQSIENMVNSFASLPGDIAGQFLKRPAKQVMQRQVVWVSGDDSVQQAMAAMQEADVGDLMVGENGVLEGIISWVDLIGAISIYLKPVFAKWRRPADDATLQIRLKIIMTRPVRTAKPETSLAVVMENMCRYGLRCLPIVDAQGVVQGTVTAFDIFQAILNTDADITTLGQASQGVPVD